MDMEPDSEKEAILARRRLLLLLRQSPEVIRALQVSKRADDESILNALGKFESPFELLRQAGCSIPKASQAEELMALAVQAPKAKRKKRDKKMYFYAAAGCDVALIFLFVGLLAWQVTEATRGWTIGTCSLTLFTNQSCMQANGGCFVEVAVRSTDLYLVKQDWTLPVEHTGAEGVYTRYYGDPFRCCNNDQGQVPNCCSLVAGGVEQKTAETFCDTWGSLGKVDWTGARCNSGSWQCLFTVDADRENVLDLKHYMEPDTSLLVIIVAILVCILMIFVLARVLLAFDVRCNCVPVNYGKEEEAEMYDPDDPAADWGQAVQEALQDEVQRRREATCTGWLQMKLQPLVPVLQSLRSCSCLQCRRRPKPAKIERESPKHRRKGHDRKSPHRAGGSKDRTKERPDVVEELPQALEASEEEPEEEVVLPPSQLSFPPGFIWEGNQDPEGMEKYLHWETNKAARLKAYTEKDIHPGFQLGNLTSYARLAQHQRQTLFLPIVEPMPKNAVANYSTSTLHYSCSTYRESRRQKRRKSHAVKKRQASEKSRWNWTQDLEAGQKGKLQVNWDSQYRAVQVGHRLSKPTLNMLE
ncbi:unnamed protein product [Effrenium voratum]|uniref:Uncharacterized protein n=1 Tax=Effrenium voratum TaxID=2562239 RepID=A0AA36I877_9DINO|nr:unnamed protein product [Effrenium voratum]